MQADVDVLVVGAGASGLTLACDLRRRGVSHRLVEASEAGFPGSRAKGVQPRSLEVLDDLGVLPLLEPRSMLYPPLGAHLGPVTIRRTMIALHESSPDVPHANTLLVPQHATDTSLRERLEQLGGAVEYGTRLVSFEADESGVVATLERGAEQEQVRARYLVGADGGSSTVRRGIGVAFEGTTDESDRMIVADVTATGVDRKRWHVWPRTKGRFVALCPLPGDTFQLMLKLRPSDPVDMTPDAIDALVRDAVGSSKVRIHEVHWSSLWRPNIRLAEHYRVGRALLAGDAAHVHPPTGAQGLNTGLQDAYNLGWKLGQVLAGADETLLDTYEAERQPVAAGVLGLASALYAHMGDRPLAATKRGDAERQLTLTYRSGPLGTDATGSGVCAGDRAPDAGLSTTGGESTTVFDVLRGPHFTVLTTGEDAARAAREVSWPTRGAHVRVVAVDLERSPQFARFYDAGASSAFLVRPDGYLAAAARENVADAVATWPTLPLFPAATA